jgi:hypothetical protein
MYEGDVIAIVLAIILFLFIIAIIVIFSVVSLNCQECFRSPLPLQINPCSNKYFRQIQQQLIGNNSPGVNIFQGAGVGISDDSNTVVFGAFGDNDGIGCVYVFTKQNGRYGQFGPKLVGI